MSKLDSKALKGSRSLHQAILRTCAVYPDKPALMGKNNTGYTYHELADAATRIAGGLRRLGLSEGGRVGILSENSPEWGIIYLAIQSAGGVVVPLDVLWKKAELAFVLKVSQIDYIFCAEKSRKMIGEVLAENQLSILTITIDDRSELSFDSLRNSNPYWSDRTARDEMASLIYTSGTTGDPKGVILTHDNIMTDIEGMVDALDIYPDDVFLSVLPLHHTLEATCGFLLPLCLGLTVVYARSLKSRDILGDIKNHKVTFLIAVPLLYEKIFLTITKKIQELSVLRRYLFTVMYNISKIFWPMGIRAGKFLFGNLREKSGLKSIRLFVSGGAPLPADISKWFNLIGFNFLEGYGLTECSPVVTLSRPGRMIFGSVGLPLPNVEIAIDDPNREGVGEIKVKGKIVTTGYLNNPSATAALLKNGWLYTGDMGKIKDGYLYITGRKKNLIVSGAGKNIYPEEIEAALQLSPFILESIVLGRKKENKVGEEIYAVIVPNLENIRQALNDIENPLREDRLREIIGTEVETTNNRLADYKRLNRFEIRLDEFEKTSTRKVKRNLYK
jgi:long-chain acyl-CoA synthetase